MDLEEEKKLVENAKKDIEAFCQLYDLYYPRIFGYILKRVANLEIAQDVASETFLKSMGNIQKFKWKGISFASWLYRIASNEIANHFRKSKYRKVSLDKIPSLVATSNPAEDFIRAESELKKQKEFLELHQKISQLPILYQEVIVLRFFEKKKIKEISEILGKREGTVKSLLHRGLKKLKIVMDATPSDN